VGRPLGGGAGQERGLEALGDVGGCPVTFTQECVIPVGRARLWDLLMDVSTVGRCVPGVETIEAVNGSAYKGGLKIQIGPIRLSLEGTITVEEADREAWRARMRAEATDRRLGGGIRARMSLALSPAQVGTRVPIGTDLAALGKTGAFRAPRV